MGDYISRDVAIIEFMDNDIDHIQAPSGKEAVQILSDIPAADVVPVVHGRWSHIAYLKGIKVMECSHCGKRVLGSHNYCGNCGAKMDSEKKE